MKRRGPFIVSIVGAVLCLIMLVAYFIFDLHRFHLDDTAIKLFIALLVCIFISCYSRLKIGDFIEIEQLQEEVKGIKTFLLRDEVVRTHRGEVFFVDGEGRRHSVPDSQTVDFLKSGKGEIIASDNELADYPINEAMDSVLKCRLLKLNDRDLFAVLNGKKYYISSWGYIADWSRKDNEFESVDNDAVRKFPSGK